MSGDIFVILISLFYTKWVYLEIPSQIFCPRAQNKTTLTLVKILTSDFSDYYVDSVSLIFCPKRSSEIVSVAVSTPVINSNK